MVCLSSAKRREIPVKHRKLGYDNGLGVRVKVAVRVRMRISVSQVMARVRLYRVSRVRVSHLLAVIAIVFR